MAFDFPVFIKRPGAKDPKKSSVYYIIAANGPFLHKKLSWVEATIPVKRISVLEEQEMRVEVLLPPLPRVILAKTVKFFRKVYTEHRSEAIVLLHYNKDASLWDMSVPRQQVSSAAISDYDKSQRITGYECMGTIHSHAFMSAFHSDTDRHDEAECADGIHITIGNVNEKESFSIDIEVAVNGHRFSLPPAWCDGVSAHICKNSYFCHTTFLRTKLFDVQCEEIKNWEVPDEWMQQVSYAEPWRARSGIYSNDIVYERNTRESEHFPIHEHKPAPALNPTWTPSFGEEMVPSTFSKIKEMWGNLTREPYRRELHPTYCACPGCKEYFQNVGMTRDGIRVIGLEEQKGIRRASSEILQKKENTGSGETPREAARQENEKERVRRYGSSGQNKKTQKLTWLDRKNIFAAPIENNALREEAEEKKMEKEEPRT